MRKIERLLESQALVEMLMRIDEQQTEIQRLVGLAEEQAHQLEGLRKRQRDLYLDGDRRLRELEKSVAGMSASTVSVVQSGAAAGAAQQLAPPGGALSATPSASMANANDSEQETRDYEQAFALLKDGRYEQAIPAFRQFLTKHADGKLANNAQYWLGEANYVTRQFAVAAEEFKKVGTLYPHSAKLPGALLKLGYTYYELQDWVQTRQALEELVQRFPQSSAARLAKNRLQRLKSEGH
ncbi:MAG: tol-pal system protein YbgF [Gammaproteobacteria bacterium]|nr:tol-pal system protein YbgF [Gammaproteobacteria bacterium]